MPGLNRRFARTALATTLLVCGGCSNADQPGSSAILAPPSASSPLELVQTVSDPGDGGVFGTVGGVAVGDDGNLYIGDYQQRMVFVLAPDGQYIRTIGSPGEGPGEFRIPVTVHARGDSIYVFDNQLYRVSVFERSDGSFVRSVSAKVDEWNPLIVMGYGDAEILLLTSTAAFGGRDESRWHYSIRRMPYSGASSESIWEVPGPETFPMEIGGNPSIRVKPLAQHPSCAFADGLAYCAHSSVSIDVFNAAGDTVGVVRVDVPPRAVTPQEREAQLERFSGPLREQMQVADRHPAFTGQLVVDDAGRLWLRRSASTEDGTEYWVIDRDARTVEARTMDGAVTLYAVRDGRAVGVMRDADGGQAVVGYR